MNEIKTDLSKEQIKEAKDNMKYIRESIIVENDSGKYEVNSEELENSSFSDEEKKAISNFAGFMNESQGVQVQANAFTRCLQEVLDIGKSMAEEVANEIDKGNWLAAGGKLVKAGLFANPIVAFTFFMTCGATPVE